jgi:DNA-binding IclR family transcriptional regulator
MALTPNPTETAVLRALVEYHNRHGCPPSFADIAKAVDRSVGAARSATISLGEMGYAYRNHRGARCWLPTDAGRAFLAGLEAAA